MFAKNKRFSILVWEAHEVLSESIMNMNTTGLQTYENDKAFLYGSWQYMKKASTAASSSPCLKCETSESPTESLYWEIS